MSDSAPEHAPEHPHHRVAVIGAGFSGLAMAIELREAGIDDVVVLERADAIGGTWRDNTYPGAQCDVQSALYSYSFAPNPAWSRTFAQQEEIREYLEQVVADHDLAGVLRLGHELRSAVWDDEAARWEVTTSQGALSADVLVSATGTLSDPSVPAIPGTERFTGARFHSGRWDHDVDLAGARVAVIGTGASAIQFVPEIAPVAGHVTVFQRTPAWILPRHDKPVPALEKALYARVPGLQRVRRAQYYLTREALVPALTRLPLLGKPVQAAAAKHLAAQVADPGLREKLTPRFALGCKRILISNDWYPALVRDDVDLVTDGIREITETAVVTADGTAHEVDVIIYGTGFQATEPPVARLVTGRTGRTLAETWDGSMRGHKCTTVAGFPNFFVLNGPNLAVGHTSMIYMIESQVAYVVDALRGMRERGLDVVEVEPAAEDAFVAEVRRRTAGSVWTAGGCSSWYLDRHGQNTTLWPGQSFSFRRETARFDWGSYRTRAAAAEPDRETVAS